MKTTRYFFLMLHIVLFAICAEAQQRNILQVPDINVQIGNAQLPISIENTDEIVGAQFDLTLPDGVTADPVGTLGNRSDGHSVTVSQLANGAYRVLLHSAQNRPLRGQSGVVMYLPINIPTSYEEGSEHALSITNAVLGKATGENVLTDVMIGKIHVSKLPDLMVKNITFDKQALNPGDRLVASWQVENIGELATNGGWSEQVTLISEDGSQSKLIATAHYDGILDASGIVSRQVEVTLPALLGFDGQTRLQVRIVPDSNTGESASAQGNNKQTSNGLISINKVLTLELSPNRVVENSGVRIMLKLNRSGNWTEAETFTLTATADSRITVPASVTIPAGQSGAIVYISLTDNDVLDDESTVTVSAEGNGYAKVSQQLFIEDNEYPNLTVVASKSVITEGETFQLTITASRASAAPMTVTLTSENNKRFTFPQTLTIPAGETSTIVTVETVDDELPSLELSNAFTASAPSYNKGEVIVLLQDNDMPVLELTLTPNTVSEAVGPVAVAGVLRRTTNTNSKITVKLSDDANGGLYFGNRTLELAKGVQEVHFNFGPVDNAQVDGDRTYTITAAVWLSSCSCNASGESAGYVTAKLNVLDNDGPALSLSSSLSTVKEGDVTTLTITRNTTDTTIPLTVNISSDYDEGLTYEHMVKIPVGQQSVDVEVTSAANDIQGDSHTVVFTVQAEGYSTGTCYVMVTDQTLPDACINSITTDVANAEVGTKVSYTLEIANNGVAILPAEVPVKIYRRGDSDAVTTIYISESIPVGGTLTLTKAITLPQTVGTHKYYAVVNEENKIQELSYNNNTSADLSITTVAPFSAVVSTDKFIYMQGEKVIITGQLTGKSIANTPIDVYVINDGARQVESVTTDDEGAFSCEWQLYAQQSGRFIVGACYPDEGLKVEMASFDVYGLRRTKNGYITCEVLVGEPYNGKIEIENPCSIKQEDVHVEILTNPSDCVVSFDSIGMIEGGERKTIKYQIKGLEASNGNDWNIIDARVVSNSGASMPLRLYYYCRVPQALLDAGVSRIETTVVKGSSREYPLTITNQGAGESGKISLALPSFMSVQSSQPFPSLLPNESTTIILRLSCTDKMQTNVPVSDYIGLNCENGNGVALPYTIIPVSESNGELLVDVCDEYTYYTDEKPHVAGAKIKIQRPLTKEVLYEGITGDDGTFLLNVPEGYYTLSVSADKHESYERNILIDPERRNSIVVNLSYEGGVSVDWNVVETEIEDEYTISTTIIYETNVPVPILDLDIPNSIPANELAIGESLFFYATLTNRGLITIHEAQIVLPEDSPGLIFESLQETTVDLSAQQSIVIPVKVTRVDFDTYANRRANAEDGKEKRLHCAEFVIPTGYWDCGVDKKWYRKGGKGLNLGTPCTSVELSGDFGERSQLPLLGRLSGANFSPYIPNIPEIFPPINLNYDGCEPCLQSRVMAGVGCLGRFIGDFASTLKAAFDLFDTFLNGDIGYDPTPVNSTRQRVLTPKGDGNLLNDKYIDYVKEILKDKKIGKVGDKEITFEDAFNVFSIKKLYEDTMNDFKKCTQGGKHIDTIFDCYDAISHTIDRLLDESLDNTIGKFVDPSKFKAFKKLAKKIIKIKKIADNIAGCAKDYYHACDQIDNTSAIASRRSENVDYISIVTTETDILANMYEGYVEVSDILYGSEIDWFDVTLEEMNQLSDSIDYILMTEEEALKYKPSDLTETTFRHYFMRRRAVEKGDLSVIDIDLLEKCIEKISYSLDNFDKIAHKNVNDFLDNDFMFLLNKLQELSSSVCATISLKLNQTMTMNRPAYRGTLTVFNGHEDTAMTDVRLNLVVKDKDGIVATEKEFEVHAEADGLEGFEGEATLPGGWTLGAQQDGKATVLFIPTKYAAPTEEKVYSFGGTLTYIDPFTGLEVSRSLVPVSLTVKPLPDLELTYLMQRDVYGDDPLTIDVVEPMEPAEFALIINNKGYGEAKNVRMQTQQPKIIDNEKGLLIDFIIKSSQVNGEAASLSFGQTIANNFGTIPAHSQAYAQWWIESSLLGHFTSYEVEATHVSSFGNEDLSLLDTVTIHEMIHGFAVKNDGDIPLRGYLVNDIADADDMPDILYFTDAIQQGVYLVKEQPQITRLSDTEYVLTVKADNAGWNYGSVFDPTNGRQKLVKVVRGDGTEVNVDNVWQTDRTLRDGRDWLYENRLHFVGNMPAEGETFYLTFEPKPELELAVESYAGVPEENTVLKEQLTAVTVKFNKPIKADSFTTADITLNCQGEPQDVTKIVIEKVNELEYKLTLNETTLLDGYYVLTVQTAGIEDTEGFNGATGKQVSWIQYVDGMVALKVTASPVEGGTVTPTSGRFAYDSNVTLKATPAEGYDFVGWKDGDMTISTDREFAYHLVSATELKALFSIKHYNVTIGYDPTQGTVEGAATGIYEHGTQLQLTAVPATDYEFDTWMIGDDRETQESSFILTVNRNMDVSALFKEKKDVPTCLQNTDGDALRINIEPLPLSNYMYITGNFKEIRNVFIYDIRGIKVLGEGNVQSGQGIYVGKLNQGIYYMQIATDRGVYRTKVLKK